MNSDLKKILNTLESFAAKLASVTDLEMFDERIEEVIEMVITVDHTGFYLYDPVEKKLKLVYAKGFSEQERKEAEETAMTRHPGYVFNTEKTIDIPDVDKDSEGISSSSKRSFVIKSRLYIPVFSNDKCIGSFGFASRVKGAFTDFHKTLLSFVGNLCGIVYSNLQNRRIQEETKKTLMLHDKALMFSSNGFVITDARKKDNPIIYVNKAFEKITGYSAEEVIGGNCRFLQGEEREQDGVLKLKEAIKNGKECKVLLKNYKKSGEMFWNELSLSPIKDDSGSITHFIGVQNDITERKKAEEQLIEATSRISALIENLQEGILVEDEHRRIVLINDELREIFAIPSPRRFDRC